MRFLFPFLPWMVSVLAAVGIIGMQLIGGGGRPMLPLLACYLPVVVAGLLSIPLAITRPPSHEPKQFPLFCALIMGCYLLVRTCFGGDPGMREYEILRLASTLTVYLVMAAAVCDRSPRMLFITMLLVACFFQTGVELYQFFRDASWSPILRGFPGMEVYYPVTVGTFANKNHLAWLLGDGALFALALACWGRIDWMVRGALIYCFLFLSAGVCLSLSRGGMVAMGSGLVIFSALSVLFLMLTGNRRNLLVGLGVGMLLALLAVAAMSFVSGNMRVTSRMQHLWTDSYREDLWRASIHDLGMAPLLGLGAGSFQWTARLMMPADSLLAHNDFAQLLGEYGLTGALLLVLFLVFHTGAGTREIAVRAGSGFHRDASPVPGSNTMALQLAAMAVVTAQVVHSFFDFNMHLASNAMLAGCCFGLLCNPGQHGVHSHPFLQWTRWAPACSLALLCVLSAWLVGVNWSRERDFFSAEQVFLRPLGVSQPDTLEQASSQAQAALRKMPLSGRYAALFWKIQWTRILRKEPPLQEPATSYELRDALTRVVSGDPGDWFVRVCLGNVLARLGDESGARRAFLQSMQRMPLYGLVYEDFAGWLEVFGQAKESEHYYRIAHRFREAGDLKQHLKHLESLRKR